HGATIGQIDQSQLFYLQSRGIGREDGVAMLSRGFVEDVIFRIPDKILRDSLREVLGAYFEREESLA
ncbi:MAG: SufD family Fe-S cluster assembly protein, partial [Verrucomicrobia bacterium]|nr:SufD family Fe-S cluster assembly protein [Verrucomicrobiota bacterium]